MIFKKLSLEFTNFDEDAHSDIENMLRDHCQKHRGPIADLRA
jgi:hypothetical protein